MKRDDRFTQPTKTMPVDFVNRMYAIVDREFVQITQDEQSTHLKAKVHKLSTLEKELQIEERKLARAFSQREYNEIENTIDLLNDKIARIQQELTEVKPDWMIKLLRKAA